MIIPGRRIIRSEQKERTFRREFEIRKSDRGTELGEPGGRHRALTNEITNQQNFEQKATKETKTGFWTRGGYGSLKKAATAFLLYLNPMAKGLSPS